MEAKGIHAEDAATLALNLRLELDNLTKAVNVINRLAASESLDINHAMELVRSVALDLLDCEKVTLFLVFERRRELRAEIPEDECQQFIRVKFGEGIAGMTVQSGALLNIPDVYGHPLFNDKFDKLTGFRTRGLLSCAIPDSAGKTVAVLQAVNKRGDDTVFSRSDERNLELFGAHIGNALAKAKLHEQAQREKDRLSSIFNYFKLLNAASDLGHVLGTATEALQAILHAEHAFVFIMDSPRSELWMQCRPPGQDELLSVRVKVGDGLVGRCGLERSEPINVYDYAADDELISMVLDPLLRGGRQTRSVLVHPVYGNDSLGKVAAVILAINKREDGPEAEDMFFEDYYTEADADALALLAMEIGDALSARSLECAYASALSVVSMVDGIAPGHPSAFLSTPATATATSSTHSLGQQLHSVVHLEPTPSGSGSGGVSGNHGGMGGGGGGSEEGSGAVAEEGYRLRSQLMSMFSQAQLPSLESTLRTSRPSFHPTLGSGGKRWQTGGGGLGGASGSGEARRSGMLGSLLEERSSHHYGGRGGMVRLAPLDNGFKSMRLGGDAGVALDELDEGGEPPVRRFASSITLSRPPFFTPVKEDLDVDGMLTRQDGDNDNVAGMPWLAEVSASVPLPAWQPGSPATRGDPMGHASHQVKALPLPQKLPSIDRASRPLMLLDNLVVENDEEGVDLVDLVEEDHHHHQPWGAAAAAAAECREPCLLFLSQSERRCTAQHNTAQHSTACTAQHSSAQSEAQSERHSGGDRTSASHRRSPFEKAPSPPHKASGVSIHRTSTDINLGGGAGGGGGSLTSPMSLHHHSIVGGSGGGGAMVRAPAGLPQVTPTCPITFTAGP